ncbi:ribosomal protein L17 [Geobacter metallireducens RCH3]|uniref:Large ribosomal subunit protein bL17 n=1 Tax=Geobacter metallireducens (strain ATCC 53774 / DSM 7210 / GS-15) TaxID=269799 RepID=RL17_GEOMG|nr:50S ribosomal protein L17 [Geobacter metallireducens]Q39XX8.1 RecName: Full=Large ribosomal subunit protein bL17; AltName: Full=50S ribosomal protein L17 [Geobacter metallireducens GS-15]ABB30896.1 ribosomal protein L17 [Geobacter metallireducens GS-15]EHP84791.1 ribosomal protein L17 [Geobacter metallireducens RCH3]
MRHNKAGRRLGRTTSHRIAMFRNMVTSFLEHERITTTDAKAKELRSIAEKMITLGKRGDLHAQRQAASYIRDKKVVTKLFSTIAPRYKERDGGYTRIIKLGIRPGDNAPLSVIELVEEQVNKKEKKAKPAKAAIVATAPAVEQAAVLTSPADEPVVAEENAPQSAVKDAVDECEGKAD